MPRHCAVPVHAFYPVAAQPPVTHARFRFVSSKIDRDRAANCGNPGRGCGGERAGSHSTLPIPRVLIARFGPVLLSSCCPVRWLAAGPASDGRPGSLAACLRPIWMARPALAIQQLLEEAPSCSRVPAAREEKNQRIFIPVNRSPGTAPLAADRGADLIHNPAGSKPAWATARTRDVVGAELDTPHSNGLARDRHATLGETIFDIALAQAAAMLQPYARTDDGRPGAVTSMPGFDPSIVDGRRQFRISPKSVEARSSRGLDQPSPETAFSRLQASTALAANH